MHLPFLRYYFENEYIYPIIDEFKHKLTAIQSTQGTWKTFLAKKLLEKNIDFKYLGVIASKNKVSEIKGKLISEGFDAARVDSIFMPIGLDIGSETPEEIAISIISELLKIHNERSGKSLRDRLQEKLKN